MEIDSFLVFSSVEEPWPEIILCKKFEDFWHVRKIMESLENPSEILGRILAAEIFESRRDSRQDFGRQDLRISAGFWPPRFWNLGRILPPEISESRQDFGRRDLRISAGFWSPRFRNLGRILPAEISVSRQDFARRAF